MPNSENPIISVKNLRKHYKSQAEGEDAVSDVSFSVEQGSFFALLGPNGAGKTTVISILTTTLSKTSGEVTVAGHDLETGRDEIRKDIGIIFQKPSLDDNLTAEENIRLHAGLYGEYQFRPFYKLMSQDYKDKVAELAELIELKEELFDQVKTFSGGMKRKLEIVRSLIHNPRILFLDEPTTGLSPEARNSVWNYLQEMRDQNDTTIFLTTHYLEEAEDADDVAVIADGKIIAEGSPRELKSKLTDEILELKPTDLNQLETELKNTDIPQSKITRRNSHFEIQLNGHKVQNIIKQIDTELDEINVHRPTLEQAYLEIINQKNPSDQKKDEEVTLND
jgi:ABC-2 type transport system ATP-binding protein